MEGAVFEDLEQRGGEHVVRQFDGCEGKTRTLFRLPSYAVFRPTSSQPLIF